MTTLNKALQEDLNAVNGWLLSNSRLKLNLKNLLLCWLGLLRKLKIELSLLLLMESLANVTATKYLGVHIDNHLNWEVQLLVNCRHLLPKTVLLTMECLLKPTLC